MRSMLSSMRGERKRSYGPTYAGTKLETADTAKEHLKHTGDSSTRKQMYPTDEELKENPELAIGVLLFGIWLRMIVLSRSGDRKSVV